MKARKSGVGHPLLPPPPTRGANSGHSHRNEQTSLEEYEFFIKLQGKVGPHYKRLHAHAQGSVLANLMFVDYLTEGCQESLGANMAARLEAIPEPITKEALDK